MPHADVDNAGRTQDPETTDSDPTPLEPSSMLPFPTPTRRLARLATGTCLALVLVASGSEPVSGQQDTLATRTSDAATATFTGRVVSAMTGGPLESARVVLTSSGRGAFTDERGVFTMDDVAPGRDTVEVGLMGFARERVPLTLKPGHVTRVTLMLSETVLRVENITVEVERRTEIGKLSGFYRRMRRGLGVFVTPEEIEERAARHTSDYLRGVAGVSVGAQRLGGASVRITRHAPTGCRPTYYLDGVANRSLDLDDLSRDDVLAIEVYRGPSETPPRFSFGGSSCGTIVIWTREGRDRRTGGR